MNKPSMETVRFNIDRNRKKWKLCYTNAVGDEFYYVRECCAFDFERDYILSIHKQRKCKLNYF